jgi:hypothetical protein
MFTQVYRLIVAFGLSVCALPNVYAQITERQLENRALALFDEIGGSWDSQTVVRNKKLMNYLAKHLTDPATLSMQFKRFGGRIIVATSDDGVVRAYSWETGLQKDIYDRVVQYRTGEGVRVERWNDVGFPMSDISNGEPYVRIIRSVRTNDGKIVYLFIGEVYIGSSTYLQWVTAYSIVQSKLKKLPFFKTKTKLVDHILVDYDPTYEPNQEFERQHTHFSKDGNKLYIPLMDDQLVTGKYLIYKFDGYKYVYTKGSK